MYVATNIQWDTDGDADLASSLPEDIVLPDDIDPLDDQAVEDFLSDETGFCCFGYVLDYIDD